MFLARKIHHVVTPCPDTSAVGPDTPDMEFLVHVIFVLGAPQPLNISLSLSLTHSSLSNSLPLSRHSLSLSLPHRDLPLPHKCSPSP